MFCKTIITQPLVYIVLDKDIIEKEIVPNLPLPKRGFPATASLTEIVNCIFYKLKTGVHWEHLPVKSLFSGKVLSYQSVFITIESGVNLVFGKIAGSNYFKSINPV